MKVSKTRFVTIFVILAFTFQFTSNSLLGPEVRLFPGDGEWFPGADSQIEWKSALATVLYPIKYVLIGPLSFLAKDSDPAPLPLVIAFAAYWTALALVVYYLFYLLRGAVTRKKI